MADLPPESPGPLLHVEHGPLQALLIAGRAATWRRLDASGWPTSLLVPTRDLFVAMYVRHEAVLSSQIEGTQSTLEDVLAFDCRATQLLDTTPKDVEEVVNYVRAMNHGLARLSETMPLSLRACCARSTPN